MSSKLWPRAAVGCCIVDGWIDHWCIDLLGMAGIKPQRCRLTTQQHTQTLVTTPRPKYYSSPSYTTKAPEYYLTAYAAPAYYTEAQVLPRHRSITYLRMLRQLAAPRLQVTTLQRSNTTQKRSKLQLRSIQVLLCPELHNHNRGGQALRRPNFLYNRCPSYSLNRNTTLKLSLLHHSLSYTRLLHRSSKVVHYEGTWVLYHCIRCSDLLYRSSQV